MNNPWGLTQGQVEAMDALIAAKSLKGACKLVGIEMDGLKSRLRHVRQKIGERQTIGYVLAYDRWRRGQQ